MEKQNVGESETCWGLTAIAREKGGFMTKELHVLRRRKRSKHKTGARKGSSKKRGLEEKNKNTLLRARHASMKHPQLKTH